MGMFDYVKVDLDKLPLTDSEKESLSGCDWQTKAFDRLLETYVIDSDLTVIPPARYIPESFIICSMARDGMFIQFEAFVEGSKIIKFERVNKNPWE